MMKNLWDVIINYYKNTFNIPQRYVELSACMPILRECVEGYSNKSISRRLKLPEDYIRETLENFLYFAGWSEDVDVSPIALYNSAEGDLERFRELFYMSSAYSKAKIIKVSFILCKKYTDLKKELESYYDKIS